MVTSFVSGQTIAWRNCSRDAPGHHQPSYAAAMTVVRDEPHELVLYRGPGYPMHRRNAEMVASSTFRHSLITRHLDGWTKDPDWSRWHVLLLMDPEAHHAVSLFSDAATGELDSWYIDLIGPARRQPSGFDFIEHGLDIVAEPDLSHWRWKDDDELEWAVSEGRYTRGEADALYREGQRAVEQLVQDGGKTWRAWRPPRMSSPPELPSGWDAIQEGTAYA